MAKRKGPEQVSRPAEDEDERLLRRMRNTIEDESSSGGEDWSDGGEEAVPPHSGRGGKASASAGSRGAAALAGRRSAPQQHGDSEDDDEDGLPTDSAEDDGDEDEDEDEEDVDDDEDEEDEDEDEEDDSGPEEAGRGGAAPRRLLGSAAMRMQGGAGASASARRRADDDDGDDGQGGSDAEDSEEGSSGSGDVEDDGRTLADQVADIPFESLARIKADGRGLIGAAARVVAKAAGKQRFSRENKDRPQELSSKRAVGRFREVIQVPHKVSRDPRFLEGAMPKALREKHEEAARKRYAFVYDDMLPGERSALQDKLKKEKNPKFRARLQAELGRLDATLSKEEISRRRDVLAQDWKTKERAAVAAGKNPYYMKEGDKRKLELLAKYQVLQEKGKLDKFMAKRARKNASKDHRYLPSARRPAE